MKTIFIRGEIVGENAAGQKRVKILANNADGLEFWTDDKSILSELLFAQPQAKDVPDTNVGDTIYRKDAINAVEFGITYAKAFNTETGEWKELFEESNEELREAVNRLRELPPAQPQRGNDGYTGEWIKEEDVLKFYYVESLDDYWIGRRLDTMYYATWNSGLQSFVWSKSRYLPWGEHIVAPDTAWKEYTYPSEPKEINFVDWLKGFYKKYFAL